METIFTLILGALVIIGCIKVAEVYQEWSHDRRQRKAQREFERSFDCGDEACDECQVCLYLSRREDRRMVGLGQVLRDDVMEVYLDIRYPWWRD